MFSDDQLVVIDLIHAEEEEIALRLMSEGAPWGGEVKVIVGAGRMVLDGLEVKYETIVIILIGIFY